MKFFMVKKILDIYKGFEKITCKILKFGLYFCFGLCLISIFLLLTYIFNGHSPFFYNIGICLFRLSSFYAIGFIACSFICDGIKKELI